MQTHRIVLGTAQLGMPYGIANRSAAPERERAFEILEQAAQLGITRLDTAPDYGPAEVWIGEFLQSCRGCFEVTSKLGALPQDLAASRLARHVEEAVTATLARLQTERIDRYLIHRAEDLSRHGHDLVAALGVERERGRIGTIGLSAYTCDDASLLLEHSELKILQHPLNLLDRRLLEHGVFAALKSRGIAIEARSVLLQGLFALPPEDEAARRIGATAALAELGHCLAAFHVSPVDVALPFVFAAGADAALIGVDNPDQLQSLVSGSHRALPDSLLAALGTLEAPAAVIDPRCWTL